MTSVAAPKGTRFVMTRRFTPLLVLTLLLTLPTHAAELKLATWNLEWLTPRPAGDRALPRDVTPKQPADIAVLRGYAEQLNADVIAIQEIDGADIAAKIFPPDRYVIHLTADRVIQRTGFAVRRNLSFTANPDLVGLALDLNVPHPLRSGADITVRQQENNLRLLSIHLKTGCRQDPLSRSTRPQCDTLRANILTLAAGESIPWHYHTDITDAFVCLKGTLVVETRAPRARHLLAPGERCAIGPLTAHYVHGQDGGACQFLILQGVGEYDNVAVG